MLLLLLPAAVLGLLLGGLNSELVTVYWLWGSSELALSMWIFGAFLTGLLAGLATAFLWQLLRHRGPRPTDSA